MRITGKMIVLLAVLACMSAPALAEESPNEPGQDTQASSQTDFPMSKALGIVGACLGAGICAVGGGYGISRVGGACIESIARQPEAGGAMFAPMVVTAAMIEGGMLFAIVVCLLGVLGI